MLIDICLIIGIRFKHDSLSNSSYATHVPISYKEIDIDYVLAIPYDHEYGIWKN